MVSFDQVIRQAEDISLGISDLLVLTNNKCDIHVYSDLKKFDTLDAVLGKHKSAIILYQLQALNTGHWVAIWKTINGTIIYADPYGDVMDKDIKISPYLRSIGEGTKRVPHLTALVAKEKSKGVKFQQNSHRFQALKEHVNTCGRWASMFILFKDLDFDDVVKLFSKNKNNSDSIVTYITYLAVRNPLVQKSEKRQSEINKGLHIDVQRELNILKVI